MPRPFNYFQYEGTGQGAFIAPFVTQFTGFYFPQDLEQGKDVGFVWRLFDDDLLRPTKYQVRITGELTDGNNHLNDISFVFSGGIFPNYQDSGDYTFSFTGQVASGDYEVNDFYTPFSGLISGTPQDSQDTEINMRGYFPMVTNDSSSLESPFYGYQTVEYNLANDYFMSFRGNFKKKYKDTASIDLVFSQFSFAGGTSRVSIEIEEEVDVNLVFSSVTFKQA